MRNVVFNSIHDRDLLLSAYKMKKTILCTDIGCDGSNKIHIGEHLTKLQRMLLRQAKRDLIVQLYIVQVFVDSK